MPNLNKFSSLDLNRVVSITLPLGLLITLVATFVPFSPSMPEAALDSSSAFGANQGVAQGLSFGEQIIFTYGPYASIYTTSYHPATDLMMLGGSLYLALSYWLFLSLLMKGAKWRWILALVALFGALMYSRDALLFSLPLLATLLTWKLIDSKDEKFLKSKWAPLYIVLLFAPFGLLPLIKVGLIVLCSALAILSAALFFTHKQRLLGILTLISPVASMLFFWVLAGQVALNLPHYLVATAPILSGYTEAMAINGKLLEDLLYLIASTSLLLVIGMSQRIKTSSKTFLFFIFFIYLFLSFKAGFIRHDAHAMIAGTSILMAALFLPFILKGRAIKWAIFITLIAWSYIDSHHTKTSVEQINTNLKLTYGAAWHGIKNRLADQNWPRPQFDTAIATLKKQAALPVLPGTTDIYSTQQAYLIASGNQWSPRPVFQSYSAYTPELALINRRHLLGDRAPDNIIFKVEPIDDRVPSLEDGASWPVLIRNYKPTRIENDYLFLQKKEGVNYAQEKLGLSRTQHTFGEIVLLPQPNELLYAEISLEPTLLGRIASIFFKPSQLQINLELTNSTQKSYRLVANMAQSGFVISPLIESTLEFGMLYAKEKLLDHKLIKSITIASRYAKIKFWQSEYLLTLSHFEL